MQLLLSTVLLFCTLSNAQMQVAPGDEDSSCVRQNPAEPDNVKVLMNSRNYEQLLGVQGAVWDQRDFDDNNPPNPYNPTFVSNIILLLYIESLLEQLIISPNASACFSSRIFATSYSPEALLILLNKMMALMGCLEPQIMEMLWTPISESR